VQPLESDAAGCVVPLRTAPDLKWRKLQRAFHYNDKFARRSICTHGIFQVGPYQKKAQAFEGLGLIHQRRRVEETNWSEGPDRETNHQQPHSLQFLCYRSEWCIARDLLHHNRGNSRKYNIRDVQHFSFIYQ